MKKILIIGGIAGIGYSFYYFFNRQVLLALNLKYEIDKVRVLNINTSGSSIECVIKITNPSTFQIKIKNYSLFFSFEGNQFAETRSNTPFVVKSNGTFDVKANGYVDFNQATKAIIPFIQEVVKKQPINVQIDGFIEVDLMGTTHTIELINRQITYSNNLLADLKLEKKFDGAYTGLKNVLLKVGITV